MSNQPTTTSAGDPLYAPDVVVPSQFFQERPKTGWQRLQFAVLTDAIQCVIAGFGSQASRTLLIAWEARRWIESDDTGVMSCESICDDWGIDRPALLARLLSGQVTGRLKRQSPV
jgi:hypothetical protein